MAVRRALGLQKRAANVNKDFPVEIAVPAGTTCSGTAGGQSNVCFMKIANCKCWGKIVLQVNLTDMETANPAGPFGGVIAFQIAGASAAAGNATLAVVNRRANVVRHFVA